MPTDHRRVQVCHNDAQVAQALQAWQAYDGQGAAPSYQLLAAKPPKTLASLRLHIHIVVLRL